MSNRPDRRFAYAPALGKIDTRAVLSPSGMFSNNFSMGFDGVSSNIDVGGSVGDFNYLDAFSASAWVKTTQTAVVFFMNKIKVGSPYNGWQLYKWTNQKLRFSIIDVSSGLLFAEGSTSINTGNWVHILMTYSGSGGAGGVQFYIDGVAETMNVLSDTVTTTATTTEIYHVGERSDGAGPHNGPMDEISLWDKELSAPEVGEIWNSGIPSDLSAHSAAGNLVHWMRFTQTDKDNFPTIGDHSSSGIDGTANNLASTDIQGDVPL